MSSEKKRLHDSSPDHILKQLRRELPGQLDGHGLFVYGVMLRKPHLPDLAITALRVLCPLELKKNEKTVKIYAGLSTAGMGESTYIMAQVGEQLYVNLQAIYYVSGCRWPSPSTT